MLVLACLMSHWIEELSSARIRLLTDLPFLGSSLDRPHCTPTNMSLLLNTVTKLCARRQSAADDASGAAISYVSQM